ncbi:MAG TPA: hypothetical protein DHW82_10560 [Spirochaetia bacterium]|nr:hypothetical protein [Spirochaetia bacterium]
MNEQQYQNLIQNAPFAFAYHKIILDSQDNPVDYIFIEMNKAFESLTGIKVSDALNRPITEVLPDIVKDTFKWIQFYGKIALNGGEESFEQYSETLKRWYKVQVYSPEKYYFSTTFMDITKEKKQSEDLEGFFQVNLDLLCIADIEGNFIKTNQAWAEILGYSTDELNRKRFLDFVHPDDLESTLNAVSQLARQEKVINFVNRYRCKDGTYRYIEWRSHPKGNLIYAAARDISERIKIEMVLQETLKDLKRSQKIAKIGSWKLELQNETFTASDEGLRLFGFSDNEPHPSLAEISQLIHPDDREKAGLALKNCIQNGEPYLVEIRIFQKNTGEMKIIQSIGEILKNEEGIPIAVIGTNQDITEEAKSHALIQESEEKYRLLTEFTSDVIWVLNLNRKRFTYISPSIKELRGLTVEEAMVETLEEALEEKSRKTVKQAISKNIEVFLKNPQTPNYYFNEIQQPHKDGRLIWIEVNTKFRFNKSNEIEIIGVSRNIENRKKLEAELILAKEQAENANQTKSLFIANMSHEIRTPLNGIIGFADLLLQTPLNAIQKQYAENVTNSAHSLLEILNDILDFSKIEAGKLELEVIETDMIELLEQASDIIQYPASKKNLELLLNIPPDFPPFAKVDPVRLKQILINLLSNAVKFTQSGEIEIKLDFQSKNSQRGLFTFSVRDTGIGISEEQQKKLFKAFSQADSSMTRRFGGTGLGLTISNMLAKKMGSQIQIKSEETKGSTFFFTLETDYRRSERFDTDNINKIKRILIVDDNKNSSQIIETLLKKHRIESMSVDNGLSALKLLQSKEFFDAVLIDFSMPYLDGPDTIRLIREGLNLSPLEQPVILMENSLNSLDLQNKYSSLGINFSITKPVKEEKLISCLKSMGQNSDQSIGIEKKQPEKNPILNRSHPVVLVAEDIEMNMILIQKMIQQILPNAVILEAVNGQEAVNTALSKKPDIILMDIQMPEMDGTEAAKLIRTHWDQKNIHIPIIALTAGATIYEKEKCLAAGMDDFITKPIIKNVLESVFKKYFNSSQNKFYNNEISFDQNSLMGKLQNNDADFKELLSMVPPLFSKYMDDLAHAIYQKNTDSIQKICHSIKGSSLNMCFNRLAKLAEMIEIKIQDGQPIEEIFQAMLSEWEKVLWSVNQKLQG